MKILRAIVVTLASLVVATLSNWFYDLFKQRGIFPEDPSLTQIIIVVAFFIPLVLFVEWLQPQSQVAEEKGELAQTSDGEIEFGRSFWFQWVFTTAMGLVAGEAVVRFVGLLVGKPADLMIEGILVGASIGIMQWFVLPWRFDYLARYRASRWALASVMGWALVGALAEATSLGFRGGETVRLIIDFTVDIIWVGALLGTSVGIREWRRFYHFVRAPSPEMVAFFGLPSPSRWWILRSAIYSTVVGTISGAIIGITIGTVGLVVGRTIGIVETLEGIRGRTMVGLSVGIIQWPILQHYARRASWWMLASTVGWAVGGAICLFEIDVKGMDLVNAILINALSGVVVGAITGGSLIWLLRHPASTQ